jgi:hypothetical protein
MTGVFDHMKLAKSRGSGFGRSGVVGCSILITTNHHERLWPTSSELSQVRSVMKGLDTTYDIRNGKGAGKAASAFDDRWVGIRAEKTRPELGPCLLHPSFAQNADGSVPEEGFWPYPGFGSDQHDGPDSVGGLTGHF